MLRKSTMDERDAKLNIMQSEKYGCMKKVMIESSFLTISWSSNKS